METNDNDKNNMNRNLKKGTGPTRLLTRQPPCGRSGLRLLEDDLDMFRFREGKFDMDENQENNQKTTTNLG
jgi:hypothetical protein